jgi:dihydrofolate reductase
MRKIILGVAVSLDGFIEGSHGEYDWCFTDQDYGMSSFMKRIDAIFFGRKSYEMMLSAEAGGANPFAKLKSYVFSNTLTNRFEGTELISENWLEHVNIIRQQTGKDIWLFGGASLIESFINKNLVDEMHLAIHPLLLGSGKPLFQGIHGRKYFKLTDSMSYSTGLTMLKYSAIEANPVAN